MSSFFQKILAHVSERETYEDLYHFPLFDMNRIAKKPFLMTISGNTDSLKSRFCFYLAKNLINNNNYVFYISLSDFSTSLFQSEIGEFSNNICLIFENSMENIFWILEEIPNNSHVFIDNLQSIYSYQWMLNNKEYYIFGKNLKKIITNKDLRVYVVDGINGLTGKPISYIFDMFIDFRIFLKRVSGRKKKILKINSSYREITEGFYYQITFDGIGEQLLYAKINCPIEEKFIKFFYLVSEGFIDKKNRSYYYQGTKIEFSDSSIRRLYEHYKKSK
ncbi:MAG: hypothetical protein ABIK31_07735 [candidate division WOR-3 bacterium]